MRDGRASQLIGEGAEEAWCYELRRLGAVPWRVASGSSARHNKDVMGLFDVLGLSDRLVLFCQVKATARYVGPSPAWQASFDALPRPPHARFLWCWRRPDQTWQVERLLRGGAREIVPWPPEGVAA